MNKETTFEELIKNLPTILTTNGEYIYFGGEYRETTPYLIARTKVGWRDCYVFATNEEGDDGFIVECGCVADYIDNIGLLFESRYGIAYDDVVFYTDEVFTA